MFYESISYQLSAISYQLSANNILFK